MDIFSEIDIDKIELVDPMVFFGELSVTLDKTIADIIVPFLRRYKDSKNTHSNIKLYFFNYDFPDGLSAIPYDDDKRCVYVLTKIALGATMSKDDWLDEERWILSNPKGYNVLDLEDTETYWKPFYFKLSNLKEFISHYSIPITPYISEKINECNKFSQNQNQNQDSTLRPYLSRTMLNTWEVAGLIARNNPKPDYNDELVLDYRKSIFDGITNNRFVAYDMEYDVNGDLWSANIQKNEVGQWAKEHDFNWPFPVDDTKERSQDNSELLQRIKQLEKELKEQKKSNSESVYIPPLNIADIGNLESENNQFKIDNQKLTEQLNEAKKEIDKLSRFIELNNIVELTEEYLKSRERNNYHSLIGGLLYLLLTDSDKSLNQTSIILSLLHEFKGEPFSKRSLEGIFPKAKTQLLSNHPDIKFD